MPQIQTPDGQVFNFPDTMSRAQIAEALQRRLSNKTQPQVQPQPQQASPQYNSFSDLAKQRGQQFAQGATEAFASLPEAAAIAGAGNPNTGALVVSETVQKAQTDLSEAQKRRDELIAAYSEAGREPPPEQLSRIDSVINEYQKIIGNNQGYLDTVTNGGELNLKPDAQDRDLFKSGDALRQTSEDFFGKPQENDQSFWGKVAQGGGTVAGMLAQGPLAIAGGSAMNSSQLYKEAIDAGASEQEAKRAAELGAWVGTTEIIPINRALKLLPPRLRKQAGSKFWKKVSDIAQSSGEEAAQEYAQTVANNLIAQGIYDPDRGWNEGAAESALVGAVIGGGVGTLGVTLNSNLYTEDGKLNVNNLDDPTKLAAGDVARELQQIATAEGFNLKNVNISSQFGAKGALEEARKQNNGEITELVKALKGKLNSKNAKSLDQVLTDYAPANAAIKQGKNKVSGYVNKADMAALARLVGPYKEGAALMNALAKSNVITGLFKDGMKGGVSQFTDYFNPLGTSGAVYDPTRLGNIVLGGGLAATTGFSSLPVQAGIVGLGRLVDAATGRRNKLSRFVNKNVNAQGLPSPSGVSLVDKAKTAEADAKVRREALARIATQIDAPPNANSPVGTILSGTGLSRDGLSQTINSMAQDFAGQPELAPVLESIQQNMDGDTNPVLELNEIIPIIGQYAQMTAPELIVATPDNPLLARGVQQSPTQTDVQTEAPSQPQSGNQFTTPENYQAGKSDNNSFARTLASQVSEDAGVSVSDKAQLMTALEDVQSSLGPDPVAALDEITTELQNIGVNQDTIDTYFKPYRDRVALQQARVGRMQAPETEDRPRFSMGPQEDAPTSPTSLMYGRSDGESYLFDTTPDLSNELADAVESKLAGLNLKDVEISTSTSNVSPSSYVNVSFVELDQDGDVVNTLDEFKLRFSDHTDRYGSDETIRFDDKIEDIEEDGDYVETSIPSWQFEEMVNKGVSLIQNARNRLQSPERPQVSTDGPLLSIPEIPRGESTNIQMPNQLGTAFGFAKDSNFAKGRDLKLALQEKSLAAQKEEGVDLTELSTENVSRLADHVVSDALEALKDNSNAIGWYDRTVTDALSSLSEIYPEIQTNPVNKLQFIWALAVTSNGTKVDKNFELAANAYDTLQRTGRFPTNIGIGEAAKAINGGLQQYHTMLEKFERQTNSNEGDHQLLADFMNSQVPVKQIEQEYDVQISGEGKNTLVRGASILGPKIGNGFFSNLYGNFDALTMDRWLMRTVGRMRGSLVKINQPMVKKKNTEIKSLISSADRDTLKSLRSYLKPSGIKIGKTMSQRDINDLAAYIAKQSTSKEWRVGLNGISEDLRKAGNGLAKYLDGQVEAPAGAKERDFIRSVFTEALGRLNSDPTVTRASNAGLTMSDLQALLWYPEKRLYDTAKAPEGQESRGYADDEAPDYANAARKLVEARKAMAVGGGLGSTGAAGPRGRGPVDSDARFNREPTGVAGILAQRIQGSPNGPTARGAIPDVQEVKGHADHARALVEIGKPGSQYENGIKDQQMLEHLAKAVGVTLKMFDDHNAMLDDGGFTGATRKRGEDAGGFYMRKQNIARSLAPGATVIRSGQVVAPFRSYLTALHEVAHGIAGRDIEGNLTQNVNMGKNYLTGNQDAAPIDTLEHMIGNMATMPSAKKNKIIKEIMSLQDNESFNGDGVYYPVRPTGPAKERLKVMSPGSSAKKQLSEDITNFEKYSRSVPEFTVDPLIMYLQNPKKMKKVAPETAKAIRAFFVNSSKIRFYSHPLAMAFAVVMAMLMKQEQAEEEERQKQQQMAPGALTPPPGALSAA